MNACCVVGGGGGYLLLPHCRATAWQWSQMLQRPPKCWTPPRRWHPVHKRDQYGLYTPRTGCTGKSSRPMPTSCLWVQSGHHELGLLSEAGRLPSHPEPPRRWCDCRNLLRQDASLELWHYHRYIEAEHYCLVATTATKIMIYYYFVIIGNKIYPYSDSIPHTNLINSGSRKPMRAFLSEAMKCSFSITSSPSSPQSGLGIHLTTFTLPVCPFSNVKTRFSWNRTHLFGTLVFSNAGEPGVQRTLQSQQRNSTTSGS